ncbi:MULTISPECIES: hypothetical protein [Microbacterium]|uniref:hypothetical protein n=1 Tax=Microbacterium TaxID=33882 RepID=UPI0011EA8A3C|nr:MULTISPECIES: hypothetical protein [Microbacterium]
MSRGSLGTMRAHFEIDGHDFVVSAEHDVIDLMHRIEAAARSEPTFVDIATTSRLVSVLITASSRVVVSMERVNDSGDAESDTAAFFDWDM